MTIYSGGQCAVRYSCEAVVLGEDDRKAEAGVLSVAVLSVALEPRPECCL